jgi:hypothetical protein
LLRGRIEEKTMLRKNATFWIAVIALLLSGPGMAADTGDLTIDNRCYGYLEIRQTNDRCSTNIRSVDPQKTTSRSLLMFFKTNIPGNETVYCTYNIVTDQGAWLTGAGFNRSTVAIKKICRISNNECACVDGR